MFRRCQLSLYHFTTLHMNSTKSTPTERDPKKTVLSIFFSIFFFAWRVFLNIRFGYQCSYVHEPEQRQD